LPQGRFNDSSTTDNLPSVSTNNSEIQNQARSVLDAIAFTPFEQCQPLSRDFSDIPDCPGICVADLRYESSFVGFLKPRPKLTFGWVQGCHSYLDSATPVKPKVYEVILKVDTRLFCRLGWINTTAKMYA